MIPRCILVALDTREFTLNPPLLVDLALCTLPLTLGTLLDGIIRRRSDKTDSSRDSKTGC